VHFLPIDKKAVVATLTNENHIPQDQRWKNVRREHGRRA